MRPERPGSRPECEDHDPADDGESNSIPTIPPEVDPVPPIGGPLDDATLQRGLENERTRNVDPLRPSGGLRIDGSCLDQFRFQYPEMDGARKLLSGVWIPYGPFKSYFVDY